MTVHFIYRSPYDDPRLHQVKQFDDKTILDWFQRNWRTIEEHQEPEAKILDFMGEHVYGLDTVFEAIGEQHLESPNSTDELNQLLKKHLKLEGE